MLSFVEEKQNDSIQVINITVYCNFPLNILV